MTPTVGAASPLLQRWPYRARNVLNKLCQSESRCLELCLSYTALMPAAVASRNLRYTDVYVAYRKRCATCPYDFSSRLGRRGHRDRPWKIIRCGRDGNWFRSTSHRCLADKSLRINIRISEGQRAHLRSIFVASCRLLLYREWTFSFLSCNRIQISIFHYQSIFDGDYKIKWIMRIL